MNGSTVAAEGGSASGPGGADGRDRRLAGAHRLAIEMHRAGAAKTGTTTEFGAFQLEFVAQHPKQRHVIVDIDGPLLMVNLDRVSRL